MKNMVKWGIVCITMLILTNCALLQKRQIDPNSWVQLNIKELIFTENTPENTVVFARVRVTEDATNVFILTAMDVNRIYVASILDNKSDKTVDDAFVADGIYNEEVKPDGFPFTSQSMPIRVAESEIDKVIVDFNAILKAWKERKHISLSEMSTIVKALSTEVTT